jgi:hypothetical protein
MPKNISIYVADEDAAVWKEARRFVRFHEDQSLSAYLTEHLRQYVKVRKAKHPPEKK